ncbi:hypothetical protein SETIT_6G114200v2 [Setaria italica]|uniref:Uncharacterized protein n=1 Tax=Setaria italica TaxID=4555 RepID=K3YKX7_SETIT|nr:hypothetical protein SETIT_6G114200v2 [Setaria italica]
MMQANFLLVVATLGKGGIGPFIGTCIISASFGVANGHVQGGMTGDLSLMCPEFIQSCFAGLAASGVLTSPLRFITKAAFENSQDGLRKGAMLFSSISCFFGLLCVLLYAFIFPKLSIVIFYRSKAAYEGSLTVTADLAAGGIPSNPNPVSPEDPACVERWSTKKLLFQNKDYLLDLYAIVLIACTYTWDLIATYIPLIEKIKMTSRKWLLIAVGPEQNALGNLLEFSLLGGIFCGAILDWLWLIGKRW